MYTDAHLVPGALRRMLGACAVVLALFAIGCTTSPTTPTAASLSIASTHTGNFTQGQNGAAYTVTVSNAAGAGSTSGTVTVTETVPTGMTLVSMAGTGWTCTSGGNTCTRADALAAGASYATITVTVNVSLTAAASLTNQVSVSGGGAPTANGSDVTTVTAAPVSSLSITKTHIGNFTQGQNGAIYTVTVSNAAGAASTSGTVTVTETVPTGMTLVSMSGTGWTCAGGGTTCTRADVLAAGASYPTITVTVNVSLTAGASLTNQVSVSGGGSATANGSNATTVLTVPTLSITKSHHGSFTQGQDGVMYTVTVSNATGASATSGTVTVTETIPAALTALSMAGTGWTCPGNTCTRADALAGGASYPSITVTAGVLPAAGPTFINAVSVSGGGSATANATDPTVVFPANTGCAGTPSGNEPLLSGKYAFLLQGFTGANNLTPWAMAGSFTADGHGNITGGQADLSASSGPQLLTITPTGAYYTVSTADSATDNRGCLALTFSGGTVSVATFHFALSGVSAGVASKGRIIKFDDASGMDTGTRASGIMRLQTTSAFAQAQLSSRYAFGLDGGDFVGGHYAMGGSFSFSTGTGNVSGATFDTDDAGTTATTNGGSGSIQSISATTGRGLLTINSNHDAIYIVNANELFVIQIDSFSGGTPILSGRAIVTPSSYTAASASGNYVVHLTGNTGGVADVNLGILTLTPGAGNSGTFSGSLTEYNVTGGVSTNPIPGGATYTVDPTLGRTTLTGPTKPPVVYLTTPTDGISAFLVGTDTDAQFGLTEAQPATTAPSGNLVVGTEDPGDWTIANIVGVVNISAGVATLSEDSSDGGLFPQQAPFSGTLSTNPNGTGLFVSDPVFYVVNGTKLFFIVECGPAVIQDIE